MSEQKPINIEEQYERGYFYDVYTEALRLREELDYEKQHSAILRSTNRSNMLELNALKKECEDLRTMQAIDVRSCACPKYAEENAALREKNEELKALVEALNAVESHAVKEFSRMTENRDDLRLEVDALKKENEGLHKKYRAIETANEHMTRNDHVNFGKLLEGNAALRESLKVAIDDLESSSHWNGCEYWIECTCHKKNLAKIKAKHGELK
jgi:chromosome segregation ATPase